MAPVWNTQPCSPCNSALASAILNEVQKGVSGSYFISPVSSVDLELYATNVGVAGSNPARGSKFEDSVMSSKPAEAGGFGAIPNLQSP